MNPNLSPRQFGSKKVAPGRYVTTDNKHMIEKFVMPADSFTPRTDEWRLHGHHPNKDGSPGSTGEWHDSFRTKADALESAKHCDDPECGSLHWTDRE